jgi:hypothetical protein
MTSILNITNQLLAYSDPSGNTDNPQYKDYDWTRRLSALAIENPAHNTVTIAPGQQYSIVNSLVATGLTGLSVLSISQAKTSTYALTVTSGPGSFKTSHAATGISSATVQMNNNAIAVFTFPGSDLSAVQVGDVMRIAGTGTFATGPFSFNAINSGIWIVLAVDNTAKTVQVNRGQGNPCNGVSETVVGPIPAGQVQFYAQDGVQAGNTIAIYGTLSAASIGSYNIVDSTPSTVYFTSTAPIPTETGLTYVLDTIMIYTGAKTFIYLESNQMVAVKLNGETSNRNTIDPIAAGKPDLIGFMSKVGLVYSLVIVNLSVSPATIRYFVAE